MKYSYVLNNFKNFTFCTSIPSSDFLYITPPQWFFLTHLFEKNILDP